MGDRCWVLNQAFRRLTFARPLAVPQPGTALRSTNQPPASFQDRKRTICTVVDAAIVA